MKILGIGVDLVRNSKIRHFMQQSYAQRFLKKFLHHQEMEFLEKIENDKQKVEYLASRWAVKEALNKAIGRKELHFSEIRIAKDDEGTCSPIQALLWPSSREMRMNDSCSSFRFRVGTSLSPMRATIP